MNVTATLLVPLHSDFENNINWKRTHNLRIDNYMDAKFDFMRICMNDEDNTSYITVKESMRSLNTSKLMVKFIYQLIKLEGDYGDSKTKKRILWKVMTYNCMTTKKHKLLSVPNQFVADRYIRISAMSMYIIYIYIYIIDITLTNLIL